MLGLLATSLRAQVTNFILEQPLTKLEAFDTNVSVVVLKGSSEAGTIVTDLGTVRVRCREMTDTSTGHKEQGLSIDITPHGQPRAALFIDYDEIALLISGIEYISQIDVTATPLTSLDAAYTTKGGFRIAALGSRNTGAIQFGVRDARIGSVPVNFSRDQMVRLSDIIKQAKASLDSIRR